MKITVIVRQSMSTKGTGISLPHGEKLIKGFPPGQQKEPYAVMNKITFASALLLILCAVVVLLHAGNMPLFKPIHPAPNKDGGAGPEIVPVDDCPVDPELREGRRIADAPDNAASGGAWGTPDVFTALHRQLEQRIRERSLSVYLSLYDFETGSQIKINANKTFNPASMIKTLLLLTALEQVERGNISLDDLHVLSESDKYVGDNRVAGAGTLQFVEEGTVYTLEELLSLMVGISDNVATNILFDRIGSKSMSATVRKLELKKTAFTRKMYDHQSSLPLNVATAFELTRMLVALENEEVAGHELSKKGIQMMLGTGDKRIGRYIDRYTDVANKVGTDSAFVGDMSLLYFKEWSPLALTIAVEDPPDQDEAIDFIGELAALIVAQLLGVK